MSKTTVDVLIHEKISSLILEYLSKNNNSVRSVLIEFILKQLQSDINGSDIETFKAKTLVFQSCIGNVLKNLSENKIISLDKPKSAKAICTLLKPLPPVIEEKEKTVSSLYDAKEIGKNAKIAIMNFLLKNENSERKKIIKEVIELLGITKEELQNHSTDSKSTLFKSIVGTKIAEMIKSNELVVSLDDKIEYLSLSSKNNFVKPNSIVPTRQINNIKKEEINPNEKTFIGLKNQKMNATFEEYKKNQNKFNQKQKEEILHFLCECDAAVFEKLGVDLICKLYGVDVCCGKVCGGVDDHGIDGYVMVEDPMGFPPKKLAVQTKCFKDPIKNCTPTFIRYFYGAMASENIRKGFMITTGKFDEMAVLKHCSNIDGPYAKIEKFGVNQNSSFGKNERMIVCIDGKALVEYMVKHRLGIIFSNNDEIIGIDTKYFAK